VRLSDGSAVNLKRPIVLRSKLRREVFDSIQRGSKARKLSVFEIGFMIIKL